MVDSVFQRNPVSIANLDCLNICSFCFYLCVCVCVCVCVCLSVSVCVSVCLSVLVYVYVLCGSWGRGRRRGGGRETEREREREFVWGRGVGWGVGVDVCVWVCLYVFVFVCENMFVSVLFTFIWQTRGWIARHHHYVDPYVSQNDTLKIWAFTQCLQKKSWPCWVVGRGDNGQFYCQE